MKTALQRITDFYAQHRRMPSYAEIARLCGYASKNSAHYAVRELIEQGVLKKDARGRLSFVHDVLGVRMLGGVEAGFPSPAEEELADTMSLDNWLIEKRESTYMLTVKGLSMKDAGILNGDVVLVERSGQAKPGDIVIAQVDDEWTIKYLKKDSKGFYLQPANAAFPIIRPKESLKIVAIVRAVIRKYKR